MANVNVIRKTIVENSLKLLVVITLCTLSLKALALDWPQEVTADAAKIIVYQPQPEKLQGNLITGRSAMSIEPKNNAEPIFGVFWFTARVDTSKGNDIALITEFKVTAVRWPESKDFQEQKFTRIINNAIPQAGFEISQQRLAASLATAEQEFSSLENLNNKPPIVLFQDQISILLLFDGEPKFDDIANSSYQRAVNTPYLVVKDSGSQILYLSDGEQWYSANNIEDHWKAVKQVPQTLVNALPAPKDRERLSAQSVATKKASPLIIVATQPTELVVSDGMPRWVSVSGGELLYVSNTETPWLRELSTNQMYILLSGRWYRAKETNGPWTFVKADELPPSFQKIPPESAIGGIRTSIAGTIEAEDALLDAQIPQTAAIDRSNAHLTVTYDGEPKFTEIKGTNVSYAVNTASQVLLIKKKYYAVDNGVWFVAASPNGPWQVADDVPTEDIATIPADTPVYNTTYVHVYHSTPTVVYVGYTPGYLWSFPYYGVPVYGTGWYYPPYPGSIYYPRPPTWGLHVGYNPWTGWHYGVTWGVGFIGAGIIWGGHRHHHHGGWYGGHHGNIDIDIDELNINRPNIDRGNINIGNNISAANRKKIESRLSQNPSFKNRKQERMNIYNRGTNKQRLSNDTKNKRFKNAISNSKRKNNIYADQQGRVVRKTENGWQTRNGNSWKNAPNLNQPQVRSNINNRINERSQNKSITKQTVRDKNKLGNNNTRSQQLNNAYRARQNGLSRERANSRMNGGSVRRAIRR